MIRLGSRARAFGLVALTTAAVANCGGTVETNPDGGTTTTTETTTSTTSTTSTTGTGGTGGTTTTTTGTGIVTTDKVDLLLMIDNSRSMGDKQAILAATVPDLVRGLVNPKCVDPANPQDASKWITPAGPLDPCPAGLGREVAPVLDLHVGIISSSIGGHGADACPNAESFTCPGGGQNKSNNDHGQLLTRSDPCVGMNVQTYQGQGFLVWDPAMKASPPGEANIGQINVDPATGAVTTAMPGLVAGIKDLVVGAGQVGCGYESQLESVYRFLVDPEPYLTLVIDGNLRAVPEGLDTALLAQRADFLRPSSALIIVGLTDENDCSTKEFGQFWLAGQQRDPTNPNKNFYLPKPRSQCATNPNDPCCRSCGQDQGGCPPDPNCNGASLDAATDDVNLRCFDQKRRFGIDFLYPLDRYVTGFTSPIVANRIGDMVANPIFSDLNPTDADSKIRDQSLVFVSFIAGVPWQDLARDPKDIKKGLKSATELATPDAAGHTTWDYIVGKPANYVAPLDPLMIESSSPRSGMNPFTMSPLASPSMASGPGANPINGREYTPGLNQPGPDDLEYACIFPLPVPRDCSVPGLSSCDCTDPQNDSPLCDPDPNNGGARTLQKRAKAYPAIRELSLLEALGKQGIPGSVCPAQINDPAGVDFGYRPAFEAILARVRPALGGK